MIEGLAPGAWTSADLSVLYHAPREESAGGTAVLPTLDGGLWVGGPRAPDGGRIWLVGE